MSRKMQQCAVNRTTLYIYWILETLTAKNPASYLLHANHKKIHFGFVFLFFFFLKNNVLDMFLYLFCDTEFMKQTFV